jgi:hypothetical protein
MIRISESVHYGHAARWAATGRGALMMRPKSNWAQIVSAVVAVFGFGVVALQVNLLRSNAREAAARQVYMSSSEAQLRHPNLSEPDMAAIRADRLKFVMYKNFVAYMVCGNTRA